MLALSFPLKPFFEVSIVNPQLCSSKNAKFKAKVVLKELNSVFEVKHNKSFTDILPKVCNLKAITQPQRKENRKRPSKTALIRNCEKRMSENIAITHLAECESDASYVRKRKMTSFTAVSPNRRKVVCVKYLVIKNQKLFHFYKITVRINQLFGVL